MRKTIRIQPVHALRTTDEGREQLAALRIDEQQVARSDLQLRIAAEAVALVADHAAALGEHETLAGGATTQQVALAQEVEVGDDQGALPVPARMFRFQA